MGGDRGAGDREKRGREVYGRREKRGGKRDSQGGGKREKKGKITQHCAIFRNRKNAKGREPKNAGREPGLKGTGSGRFKPPCSSTPILFGGSYVTFVELFQVFVPLCVLAHWQLVSFLGLD